MTMEKERERLINQTDRSGHAPVFLRMGSPAASGHAMLAHDSFGHCLLLVVGCFGPRFVLGGCGAKARAAWASFFSVQLWL